MDARETSAYIALLIAAITVGVSLGLFLLIMIRQHRRYFKLHKSLTASQILVLERERTRIATDLHDDLGPILSAAKFKLAESHGQSPKDALLIEEASGQIDMIINRIRQISNGLMPNTLLRKGPVQAIDEFIHTFHQSSPQISLSANAIPVLSKNASVNIYRIVQEALHNIIKHASAKNVLIDIHAKADKLILQCKDDGNGFDLQKTLKDKKGLGLQNMLLRTEMLDGDMSINTKEGKGTELYFEFSLAEITDTGL